MTREWLQRLRQLSPVRTAKFLLVEPSWPDSVERPTAPSKLGANYDTSWARCRLARLVRFGLIELITRPMVKIVASPLVIGADRLSPENGPYVFAVNHSSHLDTSTILTVLPTSIRHRAVVAAGADYFFDRHGKAALWSLWLNILPIDREKTSRRSIEYISKLISQGWNLIIFPEATRGHDDFMGDFRAGAAYLAIRNEVPVVPVHIEGTRRIFRPGSKRVKPGVARVTFGAPIAVASSDKPRVLISRIEMGVAIAADEGATDWWAARRRAARGTTPSLHGPEGVSGWRRSWAATTSPSRAPKAWPLK